MTSRPFMFFLQHFEMFFHQLLDDLPPQVNGITACALQSLRVAHMLWLPVSAQIPRRNSVCFLLQRSWLLRAIALELHVTAAQVINQSITVWMLWPCWS